MGFVPNQRPGSPWTFGNWQGRFTTPAELPNVLGSTVQMGVHSVQQGDVAWVDSTGALYLCTDPTKGAAVWTPVVTGGGGSAPIIASGLYAPTVTPTLGAAVVAAPAPSGMWTRVGDIVEVAFELAIVWNVVPFP